MGEAKNSFICLIKDKNISKKKDGKTSG